jgi:hypothetical protein
MPTPSLPEVSRVYVDCILNVRAIQAKTPYKRVKSEKYEFLRGREIQFSEGWQKDATHTSDELHLK